jgi:uncharacterized UBP type Zn finger protein
MEHCTHLSSIKAKEPTGKGCEECLKMGGQWVHLRLCLECGHVGCCDNSPGRHATKHFHATRHPIIFSFEPGEDWGYCYIDNMEFDPQSNPQFAKVIAPIKHQSYLD